MYFGAGLPLDSHNKRFSYAGPVPFYSCLKTQAHHSKLGKLKGPLEFYSLATSGTQEPS